MYQVLRAPSSQNSTAKDSHTSASVRRGSNSAMSSAATRTPAPRLIITFFVTIARTIATTGGITVSHGADSIMGHPLVVPPERTQPSARRQRSPLHAVVWTPSGADGRIGG